MDTPSEYKKDKDAFIKVLLGYVGVVVTIGAGMLISHDKALTIQEYRMSKIEETQQAHSAYIEIAKKEKESQNERITQIEAILPDAVRGKQKQTKEQ